MARAPLLARRLAAGLCLCAFLLAATTTNAGSSSLLTNGSFEAGVSGWAVTGGTLSAVDDPVHDGVAAAQLAANAEGAARAYQAVSLVPGGKYQLSAEAMINNTDVQSVRVEISWQELDNELWRWQSPPLASTGGVYQRLWTAELALPCAASNARVSVVLQPAVNARDARVFVDNLRLASSGTPAPCPTPAAESTSTPPQPARVTSPTPAPPPPPGVLVNGGFESVGPDGALVGWRKQGGLVGRVPEPVHGGSWAASFQSDSNSTKWLYQTVAVTPDDWYELQAYVFDDDAMVGAAWLRISWYESVDASGAALDSVDSTEEVLDPQPAYRLLTTGAVRAPPNAGSANVRIMLRPSGGTSARIHADDVTFSRVSAPLDPLGEVSTGGAAGSRASARARASSGGNESESLGVSRRVAPTPLIHRRAIASRDDDASSGGNASWWLWAAAGGVLALAAAGRGAQAWKQRRG